ncbi:hypothetical protein [Streptomyces yunnanensis]|uniref:Uncharacterized protein n=1 Tax=Streptomyces yunnanensis TaxID=156453 RepID=A0A9X8N941_9ACTN|nr:hypothetical protein [Streptomyces yunnanensis]SHN31390.1 hypothetical protein SAMN05216268_13410 [Streptomyces yunnanensis]
MTHVATELAPWVNLEKYPISELDGLAGRALVDEARASFNDTSLVVLEDFLRPEAARQVATRSLKDAESLGFRFTGSNDVFLGTGEPAAPVHGQVGREHTKTTLAYDRIDESSPLKALYQRAGARVRPPGRGRTGVPLRRSAGRHDAPCAPRR